MIFRLEKKKMKLFKKFIYTIFILFVFSSCSGDDFLTDENISDFQNISDILYADDSTLLVNRNLKDTSKIYGRNFSRKEIPVGDVYYKFFQDNPKLSYVYKFSEDIKNIGEIGKKYSSPHISRGVLEKGRGARLLMEKIPDENAKIELIFFYKYGYIPIFGNTQEGNAYVYSPDLDLSSLSSCELAVFGLANAYKMKFENWFYTGPLG